MTPEKLQAIRERVNKATHGEWQSKDGFVYIGSSHQRAVKVVATAGATDAEFIAHAREDVPKLLDEIEQLHSDVLKTDKILTDEISLKLHQQNNIMRKALDDALLMYPNNVYDLSDCAMSFAKIRNILIKARQALDGDG